MAKKNNHTKNAFIDASKNFEPGKNILIDGVPRKQVSIVGLIEKVTEDAIVSYYDINDSTGIFQVQDFTKDMTRLQNRSSLEHMFLLLVRFHFQILIASQ